MTLKLLSTVTLVLLLGFRLFSKERHVGYGSLGLLAGLALGLSASPVLAATITAVFTLVGILVPLYLGPKEGNEPGSPNAWLRPLAGWLAIGLIFGVFLRVNDSLNFSTNLRVHYLGQGFSAAEVDGIMSALAGKLGEQKLEPFKREATNLQSETKDASWDKLLDDLVRPTDTPEKNLERVKKAVSQSDLERIQKLEAFGLDAKQVLDALKVLRAPDRPSDAKP